MPPLRAPTPEQDHPATTLLAEERDRAERAVFRTAARLTGALLVMLAVSMVAMHFDFGRTTYKFRWDTVGFDMIANAGLLAIALCYSRLRPPRAEEAGIVALALVLEGILFSLHPKSWGLWGSLRGLGVGIGVAGLVGLVANLWAADPERRRRALGYLWVAVFLVVFPTVSLWAHFVVIELNPLVYDAFAYQVDGLAGFQPAFVVGAWLREHPVVYSIALLAYDELPLMLILAVFLAMDHPRRAYNDVLATFALMGLAGFLLYNLYPAVGLQVYFKSVFPTGPPPEPAANPVLADIWGPRNCMPSLHMAWILTLFFGVCRISRGVGAAALAAVGLTFMATLAVGHYWIDLVASFPLALLFQQMTARRVPSNAAERRAALVGGAALLALCLLSLRFAHDALVAHPSATLLGEFLVIGVSVLLERRLAAATLAPRPEAVEPVLETAL